VDRAQEIGLFRWKIVGEATDVSLSARERGRLVRALAEREHLDPDGRWVRIGRNTLDRWIRAYREGGFDALVPAPRRPAEGTPERLELAVALRREQPLARRRRSTGSSWRPRGPRRRRERSSGT
jgi:putative transposase